VKKWTDSEILEFFKTMPSGERLRRCRLGNPTVSELVHFVKDNGRSWLRDSTMEIGIGVIQACNRSARFRVLGYGSYLWSACQPVNGMFFDEHFLDNVRQDYLDSEGKVEKIVFPICSALHWFAVCISFTEQCFWYAEGFNRKDPPSELASLLNRFLEVKLHIHTTPWKCVRWTAPIQEDSHSCGPIALSVIERWYSKGDIEQWGQRTPHENRLRYVRLAMQFHMGLDNTVEAKEGEGKQEQLRETTEEEGSTTTEEVSTLLLPSLT